MRIIYDGYIYRLQKAGGINRYFSELISRLPGDCRPLVYGREKPALHPPYHSHLAWRSPLGWPCIGPVLDGLRFPRGVPIHPTYYHLTEPLTWDSLRGPVVLTVYDFVFRRFGHLYERSGKLLRAQNEAIKRADQLVCISDSTKDDLLDAFPECAGRTRVIHLAASPLPAPQEARPHEKPFFLFVGARVFYKNFKLAADGIRLLRQRGFDVDLLVVGPPWSDEEAKTYGSAEFREFVRLVEYADDSALATLYRHAIALVYLSAYEGFGLPVLEAMTLGTPVVALRQSSIPEVAGQAGILLDPSEPILEQFADKAARLLDDDEYRRGLSALSLGQAARFSWEKTVAETLEVYRELGQ